MSEKLRSLLQQPIRNRYRRQDLLDIAVAVRDNPTLDRDQIAQFLKAKSDARAVLLSRSAFRNPEILQRAARDYAELENTTRRAFIPLNEAWQILEEFIEELPIPDEHESEH